MRHKYATAPFGEDDQAFERITDAELICEAPGYRDLLIWFEFATTTGSRLTFSSQIIQLTPKSFEQLSGILQRSVRSWSGQPPLDLRNYPHTGSPL